MSEPTLGEIQMFAFDFAPHGWLPCDGRALRISENIALDNLLDGRFGRSGGTFNLPNLMEHAPGGIGQGPGRSARDLGDAYGEAQVQLKAEHLPPHFHGMVSFSTRDAGARHGVPADGDLLGSATAAFGYNNRRDALNTTLAPDTLEAAGGSVPRENRQPYLAMGFFIAVAGEYPDFP